MTTFKALLPFLKQYNELPVLIVCISQIIVDQDVVEWLLLPPGIAAAHGYVLYRRLAFNLITGEIHRYAI